MICPKCNGSMEAVTIENVTVDRCTGCKGIWFDANEQQTLINKMGAKSLDVGDSLIGQQMNEITSILCPRCRRGMTRKLDIDQYHIDYETCATCGGFFLDAGEFQNFEVDTVAERLRVILAHYAKKL